MLSHLANHCHNYKRLVHRWRHIARRSGLKMRPFAHASGHPIYFLRSKKLCSSGGIYLSAGIHGDEAAATEALAVWAEETALADLPLLIFPCLNPWGLIHNNRLNEEGEDLNRVFHHENAPVVRTLKELISPYRFGLSVSLHEDYDATGLYLYELEGGAPFWGEELLEAARAVIPIEARTRIDGRKFSGGILRRKVNLRKFQKMGYPESIYLHQHHSARTFTFETPSEFALEQRIRAHVVLLKETVRRAVQDCSPGL